MLRKVQFTARIPDAAMKEIMQLANNPDIQRVRQGAIIQAQPDSFSKATLGKQQGFVVNIVKGGQVIVAQIEKCRAFSGFKIEVPPQVHEMRDALKGKFVPVMAGADKTMKPKEVAKLIAEVFTPRKVK